MRELRIDKPEIGLGKYFLLTDVMKETNVSKFQKNTLVENGKSYQSYQVEVRDITDKGDYYYITYRPVGKDVGICGFGCTRLYKEGKNPYEYGTLGFESIKACDLK